MFFYKKITMLFLFFISFNIYAFDLKFEKLITDVATEVIKNISDQKNQKPSNSPTETSTSQSTEANKTTQTEVTNSASVNNRVGSLQWNTSTPYITVDGNNTRYIQFGYLKGKTYAQTQAALAQDPNLKGFHIAIRAEALTFFKQLGGGSVGTSGRDDKTMIGKPLQNYVMGSFGNSVKSGAYYKEGIFFLSKYNSSAGNITIQSHGVNNDKWVVQFREYSNSYPIGTDKQATSEYSEFPFYTWLLVENDNLSIETPPTKSTPSVSLSTDRIIDLHRNCDAMVCIALVEDVEKNEICSSSLIELLERELLAGKKFTDDSPRYRYKVRVLDNNKMTEKIGKASGKECKGYVGWFERNGFGSLISQKMSELLNSKF